MSQFSNKHIDWKTCDWQKHSRSTLIEENDVIRDFEVGLSLDSLITGQHLTSLDDAI